VLPRLESSGGSALDYFYHDLKVKYSFQIKLRDTGSYGFLLPRTAIAPTGEEALDAVLYFGRFMMGHVGLAEAPSKDHHTDNDDGDDDDEWVVVDSDQPEEEETMEL
jgi:extracellular matrix protein 14